MSKLFFAPIPAEFKESFVIQIDDEYEYPDAEQAEQEKQEINNYVININDEENRDNREIAKFIYEEVERYNFQNYIDWYVTIFQGTLEQPYHVLDNNGDILTAYSYYNHEKSQMCRMRLLFDESQLASVKNFMVQIGFTFDKVPVDKLKNYVKDAVGSVDNPIPFIVDDEEHYAFNSYDIDKQRMHEIRIVFDYSQYDHVKSVLSQGNFHF